MWQRRFKRWGLFLRRLQLELAYDACLGPAAQIACDLDTRTVRIDSALSADQLSAAIKDAGYESAAA